MARYRPQYSPPAIDETGTPAEASAETEIPETEAPTEVAAEEAPAETSAAAGPDAPAPDFGSQLFVSSSEHAATQAALDAARAQIASLQVELAVKTQETSNEQALTKSLTQTLEEERVARSIEQAENQVALNAARNDAAVANAKVGIYTKQVQQWREALRGLAPLVAFVEGKGAMVKDHGVVMRIGDAYITYGDVRAWAGVFKD